MRRALRTRSVKKIKVRTPGGKLVTHFRKKKPNYAKCGSCGRKIMRARLRPYQIRKLSKSQRRPTRPFPNLCSKCMREVFKQKIRG